MAPPKQVLIVEDHEHLSLALSMSFNGDPRFDVCGVAGDFPEAIAVMAEVRADLVIVDHNLPGGTGVDLIPVLRSINPASRYLMFSQEDPAIYGLHARKAGASGYVRKGVSLQVLLDIAASVVWGGEYFPGIGET